ncbi:MAG: PQQ-dependent sugar dehydrogenase [Haloferacaceae archaeon]
MRRRTYLALAAASLAGCAGASPAGRPTETPEASDDRVAADEGEYAVETVATGFEHPWAVEPLRASTLLVTEQPGRLSLVDAETGATRGVDGVPDVFARGQGGLLDVTLGPTSPDEPWVYLTYSVGRSDGTSSTRLARGRLTGVEGGEPRLEALNTLCTAEPFVESSGHYGSRVAFAPDGSLFLTVGDRQFKNFGPDHVAQDPSNDLGTTLRLNPDGTVPDDNPFVDDPDAGDAVFSYGHRNAQGLAVHPDTGAVWATEFGERDGDEINVLRAGANYGWPVASESCRYGSDEPVGVSHDDRADVVAPVYSWPCGSGGFPPSGAAFYDGDALPWTGDLLVGGLASQYLARFRVDGTDVQEADPLLADRGWRIRDVAVGSEGAVYVAVDAGDAPVVRLVP